MSTEKVSYHGARQDADLDAVRRQQAAAREAELRRIGLATATIASHEQRYRAAVERLDAAARRLPDLQLQAPALPAARPNDSGGPAALEAYAAQLDARVRAFEQTLGQAIAEATRLHERRQRTATAWRNATDLTRQIDFVQNQCAAIATDLSQSFTVTAPPARPDEQVELEAVQHFETTLRDQLVRHTARLAELQQTAAGRATARQLSGSRVTVDGAAPSIARHAQAQREAAVTSLRAHVAHALQSMAAPESALSGATRRLLEFAEEQAGSGTDWRDALTRAIARDQHERVQVQSAEQMLHQPPDLIGQSPALARRWASLVSKLRAITAGLDTLDPSVEREFAQLHADGQRAMNLAYARADWIRTLAAEGLHVLEDDSNRLYLLDLDHPEVWFEGTPLESAQGGFGVSLAMRTDAELSDDAKATDQLCQKLARATSLASPDIEAEHAELENAQRIPHARRPKAMQRTRN